jgi:hypothetical protein
MAAVIAPALAAACRSSLGTRTQDLQLVIKHVPIVIPRSELRFLELSLGQMRSRLLCANPRKSARICVVYGP